MSEWAYSSNAMQGRKRTELRNFYDKNPNLFVSSSEWRKNGFVSFLTTRPFTKIKDAFKRIVITGDMISPHYEEDGILLVNIYDFLLNPTVLEE